MDRGVDRGRRVVDSVVAGTWMLHGGGFGRAGSGRFGQVRAGLNPGRFGQVQAEPRPNPPEPGPGQRDFGQVQHHHIPGSGRFGHTAVGSIFGILYVDS